MKISFVLFALLGSAFTHVLPELSVAGAGEVLETSNLEIKRDNNTLFRRTDDDWLLVLYNAGADGKQCGGTDTPQTGSVAGACLSNIAQALCIDFSVSTTAAAAGMKCTAKFDGSKCGGTSDGSVTVNSGSSTRGYDIGDDVKFVQVSCEKQ